MSQLSPPPTTTPTAATTTSIPSPLTLSSSISPARFSSTTTAGKEPLQASQPAPAVAATVSVVTLSSVPAASRTATKRVAAEESMRRLDTLKRTKPIDIDGGISEADSDEDYDHADKQDRKPDGRHGPSVKRKEERAFSDWLVAKMNDPEIVALQVAMPKNYTNRVLAKALEKNPPPTISSYRFVHEHKIANRIWHFKKMFLEAYKLRHSPSNLHDSVRRRNAISKFRYYFDLEENWGHFWLPNKSQSGPNDPGIRTGRSRRPRIQHSHDNLEDEHVHAHDNLEDEQVHVHDNQEQDPPLEPCTPLSAAPISSSFMPPRSSVPMLTTPNSSTSPTSPTSDPEESTQLPESRTTASLDSSAHQQALGVLRPQDAVKNNSQMTSLELERARLILDQNKLALESAKFELQKSVEVKKLELEDARLREQQKMDHAFKMARLRLAYELWKDEQGPA